MAGGNETPINLTQLILLLHNLPGVGERSLARALSYVKENKLSPREILSFTPKQWREQLGVPEKSAALFFQQKEELLKRSREMEKTRRLHDVHLFEIGSAAYPLCLEARDDIPPPVIYARGNLSLLEPESGFRFAVLVSNRPSEAILQKLDEIVSALSGAGGVLVTGHDRPPYQKAAIAAHRLGRPILYVLDQGLRRALGAKFDRVPFAEARIYDITFNSDVDLAASPFPMDVSSMKFNLQRRDRLVACFADVLIALDVSMDGVMFGEAKRAWRQERSLFVYEGGREGNRALMEMGAPKLPQTGEWATQVKEILA